MPCSPFSSLSPAGTDSSLVKSGASPVEVQFRFRITGRMKRETETERAGAVRRRTPHNIVLEEYASSVYGMIVMASALRIET